MKPYFKIILVIPFLIAGLYSFANDSTYITFNFSSSLPLDKFFIKLNDGITAFDLHPKNNQSWKGKLFSPFGYVEIDYHNTDSGYVSKKFFFKKGRLNIFITQSHIPDEYFSINKTSLKNLMPYGKMGGDLLDSFEKEEVNTLLNFYHANKANFKTNPLLIHQMFMLSDSVKYREIEFVRQYPDKYLAFWIFATHISKFDLLKPDTLMKIYNTALTDRYKKNEAAAYVTSLIQNKIAITSDSNFPDFSVTDIMGNNIDSSKLRGKYVLIQFWASWCGPCLDELPVLKQLDNKYGGSRFKLISFSIDDDSIAFRKAIAKHSMNWAQIFGDKRLYNSLGWEGVPQLYLIDTSGRVIYNSISIKDWDLTLLTKILSEQLNK